jgi:hypothetical protein
MSRTGGGASHPHPRPGSFFLDVRGIVRTVKRNGAKRVRRDRSAAEKARDPLPAERGTRGARPGTPNFDDIFQILEPGLDLAMAVLELPIAIERVSEALHPEQDATPKGPTVAEQFFNERLARLPVAAEMRKRLSIEELSDLRERLALEFSDCVRAMFKGFGNRARVR